MVFIMFDPEKTGFIGMNDLEKLLLSLGRDPKEAGNLVEGIQLADQRLNFV